MKFADVRKYVTGLLSASFINKSILDNLAEDENENLTYKGVAIKGGGSGGSREASQVTYSNTKSELAATNVQDAIDEIQSEFNGIEVILDYILTGTV